MVKLGRAILITFAAILAIAVIIRISQGPAATPHSPPPMPATPEQRQQFAPLLEQALLDLIHLDSTVSVRGAKKEVLHIESAVMSRALANEIVHSKEFNHLVGVMGFRVVDFKNGLTMDYWEYNYN